MSSTQKNCFLVSLSFGANFFNVSHVLHWDIGTQNKCSNGVAFYTFIVKTNNKTKAAVNAL